MFSIEKEYYYKSFTTKEIDREQSLKSIVCMDISKDGHYLISGYLNGYLCLWEINTGKLKKIVTNMFKSAIFALRFIKNDTKKFEMVVSEANGQLHYVVLRDGTFIFHQNSHPLMQSKSPIFSIELLKYTDDDMEIVNFEKLFKYTIIGLASLDSVIILMLEPFEVKLFQLDRPKYLRDFFVPDISFGIGYIPCPEESQIKTNKHNPYIDYLQPQTLFTISWGKYLYINSLNTVIENENDQLLVTLVGHYINTCTIHRMSIISKSVLVLIDKDYKLKVLNTDLVVPGDIPFNYNTDPWTPIIVKRYQPEMDEQNLVDNNLNFQTHLIDSSKCNRATFNNYILNVDKHIYLCSKNSFYLIRFLNWEQCINKLIENLEWMNALSLGLDIYSGKTVALADIPQDEGLRKATVGRYLMQTIQNFVKWSLGGDDKVILINDKDINERVIKCINISIEFCIEMGTVVFLMNILMGLFEMKNYRDLFIENLQPFILCGKMASEKLPPTTIKKIIETYISKNRYLELSQILVHIGIKSLDNDDIRKECNNLNLLTPIIYIYTNSFKVDFFFPISKMFQLFNEAKEMKPFTDYRVHYKTLNREVETCKQFIGHKLLWYIELTLMGKKLPSGLIPEDNFQSIVIEVLIWLIKEEVFNELLKFASMSLFKIFLLYIKNPRIKEILLKQKIDAKFLPDLKASTILGYVIRKSKDYGDENTILYMYELVAKCADITDLDKKQLLEAAGFLLKSYPINHDVIDKNKAQSALHNIKINEINKILLHLIDSRSDYDMTDLKSLLNLAEFSPYVIVKIYLLKKLKNYTRCLKEFFSNNFYFHNRDKLLFEWIDDTLKELSETDYFNFELLKKEVLNNLTNLNEISVERVTLLVECWYANDQYKIITKLDKVKPLQLKYVEIVLEKYRESIEFTMTHYNFDTNSAEKFQQYTEILKLHIRLLCLVNPTNVLINLKKKAYYPVDDCLKICLELKAYDGAIYLMENIGAIKDALNLSINVNIF